MVKVTIIHTPANDEAARYLVPKWPSTLESVSIMANRHR